MSSVVRRAGSKLLRMIERALDPAAEANRILVYGKDDAGITQLFARSSDGTVHQITPISGATPVTCFVYRPGGVAVENVYTTWPTLVAALATVDGCKVVQIDDSLGAASTTAIVSDMTDTTLIGMEYTFPARSTLTVIEGTTLPGLRHVSGNLLLSFSGTTAPITDFTAAVEDPFVIDGNARIQATGLGPLIEATAAGALLLVTLHDGEIFNGGTEAIHLSGAGADFALTIGDQAVVDSDVISGVAGTFYTLFLFSSATASISSSQAGFVGTTDVSNLTAARLNPTGVTAVSTGALPNDLKRCDASGGAITITLPAITLLTRGQYIAVKKVVSTANVVTVDTTGADTIDGAASVALAASLDSVVVVSDGVSNWIIVVSPQPSTLGIGREMPPEMWAQNDVAASQVAVDLETQVSSLFATWKAIRAGSIVGLATRFSEAITDAAAGSAIVRVTINGVAGTLLLSHSAGLNPSGGTATQAVGIDVFVAGDLLGIEITTLVTFAPITTDLESYLEIDT